MKKILNKKGYTLIEVLAVIILITIVGSLIAAIIVISLRGSNRSKSVNSIRQSGDYTINQMTKMISYAKGFEGFANTDNDIDTDDNTINYHLQCDASTNYNLLKIRSFDEGITTFLCDPTNGQNFISSYSGSLDSLLTQEIYDSVKNVKLIDPSKNFFVTQCSFTCKRDNITVPPVINIKFTVTNQDPTNTGGDTSLVENNVIIPFETTVGFRNFGN